jgi:hypothetical protein
MLDKNNLPRSCSVHLAGCALVVHHGLWFLDCRILLQHCVAGLLLCCLALLDIILFLTPEMSPSLLFSVYNIISHARTPNVLLFLWTARWKIARKCTHRVFPRHLPFRRIVLQNESRNNVFIHDIYSDIIYLHSTNFLNCVPVRSHVAGLDRNHRILPYQCRILLHMSCTCQMHANMRNESFTFLLLILCTGDRVGAATIIL